MEIGIDIGGTFTDAVIRDQSGAYRLLKVPSTPDDPARAVDDALQRVPAPGDAACLRRFLHGTTVATNAILEGTAARVGLVTTRGFAADDPELLRNARDIVARTLEQSSQEERRDYGVMKEKIRGDLKRFLQKNANRRPLIMPIILEL